MTAAEFIAQMETIVALAEQGAEIAAKFDPELELPVKAAELIVPVIESLAEAAINGWSQATGTPITVEAVTALLPNPTPLTPPTA